MGKPGRPIGSMLAVALSAYALLIAVQYSVAQAKPCNHTNAAEDTAALQHASRRLSMEEPPECIDVLSSKAVLSDPDRNVLKQACELTWKTGSKENINCRNVYRTDQGIVAGICNTPGSLKPEECHRLVNAARMVYQGYVQICGEKTAGSQLGAALGVFQTKGPPGGAGCFKLRPLAAQTSAAICKDTWPAKDLASFQTDCMKQAATPDVKAVGDFLCASSFEADMPVCQNAVTAVKLVFHGWAQMCVHRPFVMGPFFKADAKQLASYTPPSRTSTTSSTTTTGPLSTSSKPGTTSTQPTRPTGGSGPTGGGGGGATTAPQAKHFEGPVYPEYLGQSRFEDDEDDSSEQRQYHRSKYQDTIDDNDTSRSRYESDGDDDTDGPSLARSRYEGSGDSDGITAGRSRYESSSDSDDDMIPSQSRYETNDDSDDDDSPSQSRYESSSANEEAPSRSRFDEDYEVPKTRPHRARYGIVDEEDDNDRK